MKKSQKRNKQGVKKKIKDEIIETNEDSSNDINEKEKKIIFSVGLVMVKRY